MGCQFLPQGIFSIQGLNPHLLCLLNWQMDSLPLPHLGSHDGFWWVIISHGNLIALLSGRNAADQKSSSTLSCAMWPWEVNFATYKIRPFSSYWDDIRQSQQWQKFKSLSKHKLFLPDPCFLGPFKVECHNTWFTFLTSASGFKVEVFTRKNT